MDEDGVGDLSVSVSRERLDKHVKVLWNGMKVTL